MAQLQAFRHLAPAFRVYHGDDALAHLAAELARAGRHRAVIICGRTLARLPDGADQLRAALGERCAGVFAGVVAHSPIPAVAAAAQALRDHGADAVVALGGGSAVVTARAAGILLAEGGDLRRHCTRFPAGAAPVSPRLRQDKLPQYVVPTTPTTAAAKAGSAVLDTDTGQRLTLFDPKTRAQAVFLHPGLVLTAPAGLARDAGLNALAMAVQGLESASATPLSDASLLHADRLLRRHLPRLGSEPSCADARVQLILAALLSGLGTDHAPPALASALGHCVGTRLGKENGTVNAVVLPHTLRFNAPATAARLATLGLDADGLAAEYDRFFRALGVPARLRDLGVAQADLPGIAADTMSDWFLRQNPRPVAEPDEVLALLQQAW